MEAEWTLKDAKNRFSTGQVEAPAKGLDARHWRVNRTQEVTRRGRWVGVVLSAAEYERLRRLDQAHAPTLPELLLALPQDDAPIEWMGLQRQEDCYLSVVSMGEIGRGIARRRASDPGFAAELAAWLDQLLRLHHNRLLPVSLSISRWGHLSAELGHDSANLLIAATALEHGLTMVTRNLRHFVPTGVATLNPWRGS